MPVIPKFDNILARYLYFSKYISSDNKVKYAAFLPNPRDNKTSVFDITELTENEAWDIANINVSPSQNNTLKGRADVMAINIISQKLNLEPEEPPIRHVNISGWSNDKSENKLKAQEIVKKATLKLAP